MEGLDVIDLPGTRTSPQLVLLHDGLGSVGLWRDFPQELVRMTGCRTVAYSRHGHGRSARPAARRDIDFMHHEATAILPAVLEHLGVGDPLLVGHSDGASIALIHAATHPVPGVVAIAPHVFVEDLTLAAIDEAVRAFTAGDLSDRMARHHDDPEVTFRGWADVWLDPRFRDWDLRALLPQITAPLLLVQGDVDPYGSLAHVDAITSLASGPAERLLVPGGHAPHLEHPGPVIDAIATFVARVAG